MLTLSEHFNISVSKMGTFLKNTELPVNGHWYFIDVHVHEVDNVISKL